MTQNVESHCHGRFTEHHNTACANHTATLGFLIQLILSFLPVLPWKWRNYSTFPTASLLIFLLYPGGIQNLLCHGDIYKKFLKMLINTVPFLCSPSSIPDAQSTHSKEPKHNNGSHRTLSLYTLEDLFFFKDYIASCFLSYMCEETGKCKEIT